MSNLSFINFETAKYILLSSTTTSSTIFGKEYKNCIIQVVILC